MKLTATHFKFYPLTIFYLIIFNQNLLVTGGIFQFFLFFFFVYLPLVYKKELSLYVWPLISFSLKEMKNRGCI